MVRITNSEKAVKTAALCVIWASLILAIWLFLKYAASALVPVALAALVSSLIRPAAKAFGRKNRKSEKICGAILVTVTVIAVVYGIVKIGDKLVGEMTDFLSLAVHDLEREDNVIRRVVDWFSELKGRIPLFSHLEKNGRSELSNGIYNTFIASLRNLASKASDRATSFAAGIITGLPGFAFSVVVGVFATYYMTMDFDGIRENVKKLIPKSAADKFSHIAGDAGKAISGYLKAYLIILLLTFTELLVGFLIIGVKYAFFIAAITALIDILPVLGTGTVLVPWATVLFIQGDTKKGIGLLVLLAVMYVVRQFAEPRLIGRFMGVHPMLTLCAAYVGFCFFGIIGMIITPLTLYVAKLAVTGGEKNDTG